MFVLAAMMVRAQKAIIHETGTRQRQYFQKRYCKVKALVPGDSDVHYQLHEIKLEGQSNHIHTISYLYPSKHHASQNGKYRDITISAC